MNDIIRSTEDLARVSKMFAESGYFKDAKDAAQAGVKILAGLEMGFGAFASMSGVHVIQGKPAAGANLMAAAIKRHPKYGYRVSELTDEACSIVFLEGDTEIGVSSFTLADAKKAGVQNLTKFPRNMLFARAISNGMRWFTPDVFTAPTYTPEELGELESIPTPPPIVEEDAADDGVDPGTLEDVAPPPGALLGKERAAGLHRELGKLGVRSEQHKQVAALVLGRKVSSFAQLTEESARKVFEAAQSGDFLGTGDPDVVIGVAKARV